MHRCHSLGLVGVGKATGVTVEVPDYQRFNVDFVLNHGWSDRDAIAKRGAAKLKILDFSPMQDGEGTAPLSHRP